jgi:glycosyltransferase involved in cell wall biosynthesis
MLPIASVLMCVRNEEEYIRGCILSILNQSFPNFELIIVDDLSSDNTQKIVEQFKDERLRYYRNTKVLGLSKSRNQSIAYAKGKYIFFTDADCKVSESWLENGLKCLETHDFVGVEGKTIYVSEEYTPTRTDAIMENKFGSEFLTCNIAFKKSAIELVDGFDERFFYHEDRDLALRIIKIGKIMFNPEMVVYHQKKKFNPKRFVQSGLRLSNRVLLYKKYGDKPRSLFLGRIAYPKDFIKIFCPILVFGSFYTNKYKTLEDFKIFPFIYVRLIYERLSFWDMCVRERVFLI